MIPKIIHYCWFGGHPMQELQRKCLASWKEHLTGYQLQKWDEQSFDVNSVPYVKEAYDAGRFAFVTDYVRLYALYRFGGIYMDTDVEVLKDLDRFLDCRFFSGFEDDHQIPTGIMGAEKRCGYIRGLLDAYDGQHFCLPDGRLDTTTNVIRITDYTRKMYPLRLDNTLQVLGDGIYYYPNDYFCPKDWRTGRIVRTGNTCTIHHFQGSWITRGDRIRSRVSRAEEHFLRMMKRMIGQRSYEAIRSHYRALRRRV